MTDGSLDLEANDRKETIARKLNVATVLEGSVRKSGNRLRVNAQLIRATDSSHCGRKPVIAS